MKSNKIEIKESDGYNLIWYVHLFYRAYKSCLSEIYNKSAYTNLYSTISDYVEAEYKEAERVREILEYLVTEEFGDFDKNAGGNDPGGKK